MPDIIDKTQYPSNSKTKRKRGVPVREVETTELAVPKKHTRIVKTMPKAVIRKKTLVQNIASALVGNGESNVLSYVLYSVLIPAAKSTIQEMLMTGLDMILFNGEGRIARGGGDRNKSQVSYSNIYSSKRESDRRESHHQIARDKFRLDDIFFKYGEEASDILSNMGDQIEEFGAITVADFYEMVGMDEEATWVHHKYGWNDLRNSFCSHTKNGYQIVLPKPRELE